MMGTRPKNKMKAMIAKDFLDIYNHWNEVKKTLNDNLEETLDYLHALIAQIPQSASGPLITKTPKTLRKRGVQRIETIPEDDVIDIDNTIRDSMVIHVKVEEPDVEILKTEKRGTGRRKREASLKAANNIKKQQSLSLNTKLRRPSELEETKRESRAKRKKSTRSSSDEESAQGPTKHSKIEESVLRESTGKKLVDENSQLHVSKKESMSLQQEKADATMTLRHSSRKRTFSNANNLINKKSNFMDDTVIAPMDADMEEPSMYEDAIEKPIPIMNSTMILNSTSNAQKMMNATVVLEPLSHIKLNETVTITKNLSNSVEKMGQEKMFESRMEIKSPRLSRRESSHSRALQDRMQKMKEAMANKDFDELITEDESSPEVKKLKPAVKKQETRKRQKRVIARSASSSEDEILSTPAKPDLKEVNAALQEVRGNYKSNALFSPYAKESVKKRVEAFEQAGLSSPKPVDVDAPTRVTRTKTRAIAAAQAGMSDSTKTAEKTVAHKLARKSLAKAKKISLMKQIKDVDEHKENKAQPITKIGKLVPPAERANQKGQQKTTPLGKTRIQLPLSVNRNQQTPANNQMGTNYGKALSATRANIVTAMDSFIQMPKSVSKPTSADKTEEKRRRINDEDARKKRDDALRLQTEEKKRKREEKELKNKLARQAKEKQDMEKRQKAEKEKEEKARIAQQMHEKQREEMEKKRLAQLQRAQEKEERRKQEEQQRQNRLQEQEEAERVLAEQRRREQEIEKRKEMELRAQQHVATEAMKAKTQMLMPQAKHGNNKHHGPTNYILDSEPDDDESDDESRPKHLIPYWAQPQVRKIQLSMQRYIPDKAVFKFFDTRKCTPDLAELFQGIDRNRLKRTSSAIWKTPPRYSMMNTDYKI